MTDEVESTEIVEHQPKSALMAGGSAQLMGANISLAAHNGAFDAARVRVERVFSAYPGDTSMGSVVLFEGNCAGVDPSSTQVVLHVKSDLELLQYQMPRILFQPGCANCFGDSGCGISLPSLTTAGSCQVWCPVPFNLSRIKT